MEDQWVSPTLTMSSMQQKNWNCPCHHCFVPTTDPLGAALQARSQWCVHVVLLWQWWAWSLAFQSKCLGHFWPFTRGHQSRPLQRKAMKSSHDVNKKEEQEHSLMMLFLLAEDIRLWLQCSCRSLLSCQTERVTQVADKCHVSKARNGQSPWRDGHAHA